MSIIDVE